MIDFITKLLFVRQCVENIFDSVHKMIDVDNLKKNYIYVIYTPENLRIAMPLSLVSKLDLFNGNGDDYDYSMIQVLFAKSYNIFTTSRIVLSEINTSIIRT